MGETPSEVQRDIARLRQETGWIVDELEYRVMRALDVRAQARLHPFITGGVLLAVLGALGFLLYRVVEPRRRPQGLAARLRDLAGMNGQRPGTPNEEGEKRRSGSMMKRVMWTILTAVMVGLATIVARRLSASLWESTVKEKPPKKVT
jgi:hypothetical protein